MRARGAAIQGGLAALGLAGVYLTWQREPERGASEVIVLEAGKNDLQKIRYEDGAKWTEVERRGTGDHDVWVRMAPKPESKIPEREVRGNESAARLWARFAPLRGLRALGVLDAAKLKELGLDAAKKKIEVTVRGDKRSYVIANPPAGGTAPYFKDERDGRVYVVESVASDLDAAAVRLVTRQLHTFKKSEWDGLTITAGGKTRALVQTSPDNPVQARLASAKSPDKPDEMAKNWHDKAWSLSVIEVLGKGERPAAGEPEVVVRLGYSWRGKELGFAELGRVAPQPLASGATPAPTLNNEVYLRSEFTAGWVKVSQIADDLMKEAEKIASGE